MKITICGSMKFAKEMHRAYETLAAQGHEVFLPKFTLDFVNGSRRLGACPEEGAKRKKEHDLIRQHYKRIQQSDAILVINNEKNGIENYIGANTLIEMAFAHVLNKKIYLLNDIPEVDYLLEEVKAMEPVVLNGEFQKIG